MIWGFFFHFLRGAKLLLEGQILPKMISDAQLASCAHGGDELLLTAAFCSSSKWEGPGIKQVCWQVGSD